MTPSRVPHALIAEAAQRWAMGDDLRAIASELGLVCYERWRQLIRDRFPEVDRLRREWRAVRVAYRRLDPANAPPCVVCWGPVPRARRRGDRSTCDPECAAIWRDAGRVLDERRYVRHRIATARWELANPDHPTVSPGDRELAEKIVAGIAPAPNRRFSVRGSRASLAAEKGLRKRGSTVRSGRVARGFDTASKVD